MSLSAGTVPPGRRREGLMSKLLGKRAETKELQRPDESASTRDAGPVDPAQNE
jgi:hypothetical protein